MRSSRKLADLSTKTLTYAVLLVFKSSALWVYYEGEWRK